MRTRRHRRDSLYHLLRQRITPIRAVANASPDSTAPARLPWLRAAPESSLEAYFI